MKFRTHLSKKGTLFLAGRTAENNEELMKEIKGEEYIFHTEAAGSPFVVIKGEPKAGDLKEAAVVCARYSRDWKKSQGDVIVSQFRGTDVYKNTDMKMGTFGVKKRKQIKVKKEEIENFNSNSVKESRLKEYLI